MPSRMRIIYANLKNCYPSWSKKQIKSFAIESGARTIEMGMFVLASPYMSKSELKKRFTLSDSLKEYLKYYNENPQPLVLLVPHFCMMEAITMLPILHDGKTPKTGVFYRPMNSKAIDDWVLKTRSRFGINLISRRAGLTKAFNFLKDDGVIAVLFDQNAGSTGFLGYFFSMPCYSSNLAGLFAEKYKSDVGFMYAKRTGFFRAEIHVDILECEKNNISVTIEANKKLETLLREDEELSADWLWLHDRWKVSRNDGSILNLVHSKDILAQTKPTNTLVKRKIFVKLPKELEDIKICADWIKKLSVSRQDCSILLLAEKENLEFVSSLNIGEQLQALPSLKDGIFKYFRELSALKDECALLLIDLDKESPCLNKKLKAINCIKMSSDKVYLERSAIIKERKERKKNSLPKLATTKLEKNLLKRGYLSIYIDPSLAKNKQYFKFFTHFGLPKK